MKKIFFVIVFVLISLFLSYGCKKSSVPTTPADTATPNATQTVEAQIGTVCVVQTKIAQTQTAIAGLWTSTITPTATMTGTITQTSTVTATCTITNTPNVLEISGTTTLNAGTYNYDTVHIYNGGILQLAGPGGAVTGAQVTINCSIDFILDAGGQVLGNGAGYAVGTGPGAPVVPISGGGHGGKGGMIDGGLANDDAINPTDMGSGGGMSNGGAFFKVVASNQAVLNGVIQMNGQSAFTGGAGGTVFIKAGTILGNGTLEANGGQSTPGGGGGGGGGGIILLNFHSSSRYMGSSSVLAGGTGTVTGENGFYTVTSY